MSGLAYTACIVAYLFVGMVVGRISYSTERIDAGDVYRFDEAMFAGIIWPLTLMYWAAGRIARKVTK